MTENAKDRQVGKNAFCTFCMGAFDPARIGAHIRRCRDRVDDAECIQTGGSPHPMAFILMMTVEEHPDAWLVLEAHGEARFSHLDRFIRREWFPDSAEPGQFVRPRAKEDSKDGKASEPDLQVRLENALSVKDRLCYRTRRSKQTIETRLEVIGYLPTAIMHRPVDVAAFPLHGRLAPRHPFDIPEGVVL